MMGREKHTCVPRTATSLCGELCLLLHTHPSALLRDTLGVLSPKKAKEKEGVSGREKELREQEGHGHGCPESGAVQVKTCWERLQLSGAGKKSN